MGADNNDSVRIYSSILCNLVLLDSWSDQVQEVVLEQLFANPRLLQATVTYHIGLDVAANDLKVSYSRLVVFTVLDIACTAGSSPCSDL